ncbi:hypothetical protein FF36_04592 [Frankia torreyi]|uniref:Uncharacterized protein n=1 Tax=Frankia torreyi TaxID=1856 RepID=A0A0D8BCG3_9ACTN|nr:hypothetical protein [Frankia torreyi]KJE21087.1 hypothetical protein FF36_04592 [Frankia torreyi]
MVQQSSRLTYDPALIREQLDAIMVEAVPIHPFERPLDRQVLERLLPEYLAMSIAFPYLQAAAQRDLALHHIHAGMDFTEAEEITLVVGSFLVADETAVNSTLMASGPRGLPDILQTRRRFHSALLRQDIQRLLGEATDPRFSDDTKFYLHRLLDGLSSMDMVTRVATMVSFEAHAERMINGLWERLAEVFTVDRSELAYFHAHVGGDDPAEQYHVAMTGSMITRTLEVTDLPELCRAVVDAYHLHSDWCGAIAGIPAQQGASSL